MPQSNRARKVIQRGACANTTAARFSSHLQHPAHGRRRCTLMSEEKNVSEEVKLHQNEVKLRVETHSRGNTLYVQFRGPQTNRCPPKITQDVWQK